MNANFAQMSALALNLLAQATSVMQTIHQAHASGTDLTLADVQHALGEAASAGDMLQQAINAANSAKG